MDQNDRAIIYNETPIYLYHVTESRVRDILSDVGLDNVEASKFENLRHSLAFFYAIYFTERSHTPKISRTEIDEKIGAIRNASQLILRYLQEETEVARALRAAETGLLFSRAKNQHPDRGRLDVSIAEVSLGLEHLELVTDHLFAERKKFDAIPRPAQGLWRFTGESPLEKQVNAELFPYLRRRPDDKPEHYAVRMIADIYKWLYDEPFKMTVVSKGRRRNANSAQYAGPGIDFACSVITRLGLADVFGAGAPKSRSKRKTEAEAVDVSTKLANKIGHLLTNDRRKDGPKPHFG